MNFSFSYQQLSRLTETNREYLPELERSRAAREKALQDVKDDSVNRLMKDLEIDRARNPNSALNDRWDPNEDDEDDDDDAELNLIDRSK